MTRRLLLVALLVAATSLGVSIYGSSLQLAVMDESQFPASATHLQGALVYGSDAGAVYVNDGTQWERLAGGGVAIYGDTRSDPVRRCSFANWSNTTPTTTNYGLNPASGAFGMFDGGSLYSASPRIVLASGGIGATNGLTDNNNVSYWRGTGVDEGGFTFWARWAIENIPSNGQFWAGMLQDIPAGSPSNQTEVGPVLNTGQYQSRILFLCRPSENLRVCAGISRASTTCTDLGASFPCVNGSYFDTSFIIEPVQAGNVLGDAMYYATNLATQATTSGAIPGLPDAGLRFLAGVGFSQIGSGNSTRIAIYDVCMTSRL